MRVLPSSEPVMIYQKKIRQEKLFMGLANTLLTDGNPPKTK